jgi:fatty acid desaturase
MQVEMAEANRFNIGIDVIRRLSKISAARWLVAALCNWAGIIGVICICHIWSHWLIYLGAIVYIGARQHAIGVLTHEGVHYHIASNRFWNDFLSDYLAGYAILTPTCGFRNFHLKHHRLLDTANDPERIAIDRFEPEWAFPMPRWKFFWFLLRDLSGVWPEPLYVLQSMVWNMPGKRARHIIQIAIMYSAVISLLVATGYFLTFLLFWLLPLLTVFPVCFRLRTVAEHSGVTAQRRYARQVVDTLNTTRTIISNPVTRFFIAPYCINYHTEHHLYPSVPYFRLPEINRLLRDDPEFAAKSHQAKGYSQIINELTVG